MGCVEGLQRLRSSLKHSAAAAAAVAAAALLAQKNVADTVAVVPVGKAMAPMWMQH